MAITGDDQIWWEGALALVAEPGGAAVGPARMRQGAWMQTRDDLLAGDPLSAVVPATRQGFVLSRDQARRLGVSENQLRRELRRGAWTRAARGMVCPLAVRDDDRPRGGSPEITIAAAGLSRPGAIVSHESAATLQGLTVLRQPARTILTTTSASMAGGWPTCLVQACPTPPGERDTGSAWR